MYRLTNAVRNYAWGTADVIPQLLGIEATGQPQAELWVGAHPSDPSMADTSAGRRSLADVIAADPEATLGQEIAVRFNGMLPFLMKVLSAAEPLSLQAHPSRERARAGYAAENAAGVPLDSPLRNYKDANHKPELVFALTSFEALNGFKNPAESVALLELLSGRPGGCAVLDDLISDLSESDESAALRHATQRLLTLDTRDAVTAVTEVVAACAGLDHVSARTAIELDRHHPGDAGVILSLLLNRVSLAPGEAMYLSAGNLHSYLRGTAVEIMATSDNVLRGGLTPKHIDVPELLAVVEFVSGAPELEKPQVLPGQLTLAPPIPDFQLSVLEPGGVIEIHWDDAMPRTALVLEGQFTLRSAGGRGGDGVMSLRQGESVFVTAADAPVTVVGAGRLVAAAPGIV